MSVTITTTIYSWLRGLKIPVSKNYLKQQLLSHPDYPSLKSITDILDELGIENAALVIDKDKFSEIATPFLAHLVGNKGEFVIVRSGNNVENHILDFYKSWDGIILIAEKPEKWIHRKNYEWLKKERREMFVKGSFFVMLLSLIIGAIFISSEWRIWALLFTSAIGIFISWMIVSKDLGIENEIANQICSKEMDCDSVIKAEGAQLPLGIGLSDFATIWFTFLLISCLISTFSGIYQATYYIFSILTICSLPFIFFSIYYQWRVIKKWCRLCLYADTLLIVQFVILISNLEQLGRWEFLVNNLMLQGVLLLLIAGSWLYIKFLLTSVNVLENKYFPSLRFKINPSLITAFLEKQRKVDVSPFSNDLQLGNPRSFLQITIACNPHCKPCAETHAILHELVERNDIGLTIRFVINTENTKDKKFLVLQHIYSHLALNNHKANLIYKRTLLYDWFKLQDLPSFANVYPVNQAIDVLEILESHSKWTKKIKISHTPTIFINGYELEKPYSVTDLPMMMTRLITHIEESQKTKEEITLSNFQIQSFV